ncbi:putative ubiquitin carboxyl-terminal hydrolase FAF-X [Portunus trituberculatus]|uniref:Putative ubiquitin carboxyl-terminal hydrolase FAF-X n=1 Tax=Portunus trituberculatus TaxID=210409 RepID=A0A5B7G0Q1_PORTR|nr:putative ubiquitin carboxyl-terminal hydrolase FAF-X [Portunus trituberculatus]
MFDPIKVSILTSTPLPATVGRWGKTMQYKLTFRPECRLLAGLARNGELIDYDPEDMKPVCSKYKLTGIVVHSGQASGGHYYSYILHRIGKFTGEGMRPIRMKFKSQKDVDELVEKSWRLA